jgi:stage II sporulation protein AA (anti-sigma F factor antagonist)
LLPWRGEVLVLTVAGRLAAASCGELTQALMDAIGTGTRRIVVDLSGVDYISSAGLLALEAVAARMRAEGGALVLCGLTVPVRRALDLAGSLVDAVEPSSDAAVERLMR